MLTSIKTWFLSLEEKLETFAVNVSNALLKNIPLSLLVDAGLVAGLWATGLGLWAVWANLLLLQTFSATYNSRAKNSASLGRHIKAGIFSHGVWFASQAVIIVKLVDYLQNSQITYAVFAGVFYALFSVMGGVLAQAHSLKTESGIHSVGANKKFAQIPVEEWDAVQAYLLQIATDHKE